ncbi:putative nicotinamide-nucleotide or nicotinate-nucleotide adenylyltransferase [Rhodotorula taiwanensis]|uniref:Nicotinamide-nucleotide adenylyltransferase n=1 Tax=Rhodotorula taiwanensis TaxID=741276 RepID=A0A2S5B568_9BASI|nr:putative nicotinamide-nucleotide or nicotinate-nucleotide adenylyltransferase [Rhodotorula taiwanensis]
MDGPYQFPTERLSRLQGPDVDKTPLVLVACGSYSPVTFLHLRLFEMARDDAHFNSQFHVVAGYLSPVNDRYAKLGLASADHRVEMCRLATTETSEWLMVDPWEARQPRYLPTAQVLDHFDHEINQVRGGVECEVRDPGTGHVRIEKKRCRIMLLAGSDLILTMSEPGVWAEKDLHHILGIYGCYIIERSESELDQSIFSSSSVHSRSPLALYRHNIHMVEQTVRNDVSSTKVRLFIRKGMSVKYLIPTVVIRYINRHGLYRKSDRRRDSLAQATPSPNLGPHPSTSSSSSSTANVSSSLSLPPSIGGAATTTTGESTPSRAEEAERTRERERHEDRARRTSRTRRTSSGGGGEEEGSHATTRSEEVFEAEAGVEIAMEIA